MRVLLDSLSKFDLFDYLKRKNNVGSLKALSKKLNISFKTINNWKYDKNRYLPSNIIPKNLNLKILDKKPENWGKTKGGKKTYQIILRKYGKEEIRRRQSKGGQRSFFKKDELARERFIININNPLFLEFYGALLGDGWLSALSYNYKIKKSIWWVGVSGHALLDQEYLMFLKKIIKRLFNKNAIIKYKKNSNGMEILFCHKYLVLFMNQTLHFPIGLKIGLEIENKIAKDWKKLKHVIRGIFDTDGCFYFDKVKGYIYPNIDIHLKSPKLLDQIEKQLRYKGFKPQRSEERIRLKGIKQTLHWMNEITPRNKRHILKYDRWKNNYQNVPS